MTGSAEVTNSSNPINEDSISTNNEFANYFTFFEPVRDLRWVGRTIRDGRPALFFAELANANDRIVSPEERRRIYHALMESICGEY